MTAQIALQHREPVKAIESLQPTLSYEEGAALYPAYLRGLACFALRRGSEAEVEFQKILDHPGIVLNSPIGALAHLQLGRTLVLQGELAKAKARTAYQDFSRALAEGRRRSPDFGASQSRVCQAEALGGIRRRTKYTKPV